MVLRVQLKRSTMPSHSGWYNTVFSFSIPSRAHTYFHQMWEQICPTVRQKGFRYTKHRYDLLTKQPCYTFCFLVGDSKPHEPFSLGRQQHVSHTVHNRSIMSTPIFWKGHSICMGLSGGLCWQVAPVTIAQSGHFQQKYMTSAYISCHNQCLMSALYTLGPEKWPLNSPRWFLKRSCSRRWQGTMTLLWLSCLWLM